MTDVGPLALARLEWSSLSRQQLARHGEELARRAFRRQRFQAYSPEASYRGTDLVVRKERGPFIEIHVKATRNLNYVFFLRDEFPISDRLWACVALYEDGLAPSLFLIPSSRWRAPDRLFVDRHYEGLKSKLEYGLNLSQVNMPALSEFAFDRSVTTLAEIGQ